MQKPSKVKPKTPKRSTTKNPVEEPEAEPVISHGLNLYHLGTEIGRGGFAVVFQAFNATTGQTVAVKRFPLSAIAGKESQLSVQLAEIELMHELDHPNIVKYYDTVKTKSFLYIVLEYMENGSLVNLIRKFGCFSETLTAIYVMQVLHGLKYLHDQGVLHRDIKGANILTSKDGMVKLADFGVAMKMADVGGGPSGGGLEDNPDLAGSPYWMAPEIIEMSTPTSACDIWSVGCVVIELLTSKPPYYDMDPMSALFRIVSDDYPPFPEGISQAAKDFLLQCFHKEPSMRSSAAELLSHPWLSNSSSRQSLVQTSQMLQSRSIDAQDTSVGQSTEVIQSAIRMYEKNLQTIPEAENELIDTDRSRVTADSHHPLQSSATAGMSARTSARDSARSTDGYHSQSTGRSSSRYSARSEASAADSVVSVEVKPLSALQEEDPNWHSVLLTGSTSLPGSADSRSRSHSGGDETSSRPSGSYDSNFAISAESGRSSSLISQHSSRAAATTTPLPSTTAASFLQPTASERDASFEFDNSHMLASPQKLSGEEGSPSSAPALAANRDANMKETTTAPSAPATIASPRSGRTLSARSGSLQGMTIISDDSMDETNWDIDFTVSVSRDSFEEAGAAVMPRHHLLRNALGVAQQHSPGRSKGSHHSNAPFLINLNAQSMSFTGSTPVDPPAHPISTTSAGAADTSKGFESEEDDFMHEHTVAPPAAEHVRRMQIPQIKIPALTLPKPPSSSLYSHHTTNHSHHSSIDLLKYQDNPEDDDFAEFDNMSQLSTPRGSKPTKTITNKFSNSNRTLNSAPSSVGQPSPILKHTQYIATHSDDDFESDFALDASGFDDKIKAFKTNSRQSSISVVDMGEGGGEGRGSSSTETNNILTARTDHTTTATTNILANQLRMKIQQQQQQITTKDNIDEDLDAFINYQYDEKDFKQNETKDLHFRRSREIVEIMNLIRQEVKIKEIIDLCNQLLNIFSDIPEQRDHLITHHGVMPIVDMFDTRCSSSTFRSGAHTSSRSTKALYVLKVVNKIIEGNVKAKEQLSLVGIIPTVMNLFDNSFRHSVYHPQVPQVVYSNIHQTATVSSSTSTDSVGEITHQVPGITLVDPRPPLAPHIAMRDDIDPVTLEAARFIHQICSTSSLTLQMLIGAGGLSVLTSMVSLGSTLSHTLFSPHAMNTAAAALAGGGLSVSSVASPRLNPNTNNNNVLNNTPWINNSNSVSSSAVTLQRSASGSSSPLTDARAAAASSSSHGIATLAAFSNDCNEVAPVTEQQLADDVFFNPKSSISTASIANIGADNEEILNRMAVFQMGVDCVAEVFSMKASRSRDFCRLFVKLGLLQPLALSFQNILAMFRARQLNSTNTSLIIPQLTINNTGVAGGGGGGVQSGVATAGGDSATTSSTNATPRESFRSSSNTTIPNSSSVSNQHRRDGSGLSLPSPRGSVLSLPSPRQTTIREDSLASSNAGSFYLFSSQQEAEESAECKYALRMATLFFTFSRSDAIVAETMVKAEHCVLHVLLTALQAPELRSSSNSSNAVGGGRTTPSSTNQNSNKTEFVLSAASLSAHNAGTTTNTSPSLLRRTHVHLLPTYAEIMDLLLKCLKNLSMEPSALADLEAAGTLETLVPLLSGPMSDRYRNHILPCIFNMCRINKRRQEHVTALGIVPHLKKVISDNSPLRQFALPILFDLAHTCDATRKELGKWNCQAFFLDLLKENYWQAFALNSLAVWLTSDPSSVVSLLIEPVHLSKLIEFFKSAHSQTIHTLHRPLLDMMLKSSELCKALGKISLFTNILIQRLRHTDEAIVLRSLLKMLQLLYEVHDTSKIWVESNNLIALVEEFAKTERKVLVRQLARKLLIDFTQSDT